METGTDAEQKRVNHKGGVTVSVCSTGVMTLVSFVRLINLSNSFSREDADGDGDGDKREG